MLYVGNQKLKPPGKTLTVADHYDSEIEYLETTGTQWIDTGVVPAEDTIVNIKFMPLTADGGVIVGYSTNDPGVSDLIDWRLFNYTDKVYFDWFDPTSTQYGRRLIGANNSCKTNTIYEFELGNYYVKDIPTDTKLVDGTVLHTGTGYATIKLCRGGGQNKDKFYYLKIFKGSTLIRDFIPVRIETMGYMYDKISGKLFGNKGTGNFILGPDKEDQL